MCRVQQAANLCIPTVAAGHRSPCSLPFPLAAGCVGGAGGAARGAHSGTGRWLQIQVHAGGCCTEPPIGCGALSGCCGALCLAGCQVAATSATPTAQIVDQICAACAHLCRSPMPCATCCAPEAGHPCSMRRPIFALPACCWPLPGWLVNECACGLAVPLFNQISV